ncbi:hypothetical protein ONZ45_g16708 [Pleurotus djamor]|nr:hypothetical protein ONZ45_g16708 [Pleurotus djamor]
MVILVTPKNAGPTTQTAWRLHALNRPDPSRPGGERWDYEAGPIESRPSRLLALALLGKTEMSGQSLGELVKKVGLKQDDDQWSCVSWVEDAVEFLRKEGVLPPGMAPHELYKIGSQMASDVCKISVKERMKQAVPTCDQNGQIITSEVC